MNVLEDERTGEDRRARPGSFRDRGHLVGIEPPAEEERVKGQRRRKRGTIHDRTHLFTVSREKGRTSVSMPTLVSYLILAAGLAVVIAFGGHFIGQAKDDASIARTTQQQIQDGRRQTTGEVCKAINVNAAKSNENTAYIERLIVGGSILPGDKVKAVDPRSKLPLDIAPGEFSKWATRQFGFPSPNERLAKAKVQARGIRQLNIPPLDCAALQAKIKANKG